LSVHRQRDRSTFKKAGADFLKEILRLKSFFLKKRQVYFSNHILKEGKKDATNTFSLSNHGDSEAGHP
jgi:hypothetical protein